jgi:hypothetical protein
LLKNLELLEELPPPASEGEEDDGEGETSTPQSENEATSGEDSTPAGEREEAA